MYVFSFIPHIKLAQGKSRNSISFAMGNIFAESKGGFCLEEVNGRKFLKETAPSCVLSTQKFGPLED